MMSTFNGWLFGVVLTSCVFLYLYIRKGPVAALGAAIVLSFAFPVWLKVEIAGMPANIRTAIACIAMFGYICHPKGKILSPLTMLDCCIAMLYLSHIWTDSFATGFTPSLPFRAYGEWALPFVAGRYAVRDRADLHWISKWVTGVLLILSFVSIIESTTKVNLYETVFGNRPVEMAIRSMERFGFKRAFGPTMHAIFFGMFIAILTPWLTCLWKSSDLRDNRSIAIWVGLTTFAGILATVSRTPVLTILIAAGLLTTLRIKALRWPLGVFVALAISVFAAFPTQVTDTVSRWTGGFERQRMIEIGGEAVVTSSSRSRLHVFHAYLDEMIKAGPFGYGTIATDGFPPRIPGLESRMKSENLFKTIDNGYVLLALRFGWIGSVFLAVLLATSVWTGFLLYSENPEQLFPAAVACLLLVIAILSLWLVWLSYDFALPMLWTIGVLSGLVSAQKRSANFGE